MVGLFGALAGALIVLAGFRYEALNWIVDGPGWIVSRFVSVDFHEGEGAFGFLLAVFLTWGCAALIVFAITSYVLRKITSPRFRELKRPDDVSD